MSRLTKIEEFIVAIEDSATLLKLYIQRLARSPGNANYYRALAEHAAEIKFAAETLDNNLTHELATLPQQLAIATVTYVEYLVDLANLIDELATRLGNCQSPVAMEAIDILRDGVAGLEKLTYNLSRVELSQLDDVAQTIKSFKHFLYNEPLDLKAADPQAEPAKAAAKVEPGQPASAPAASFEEEDPFDEIEIGSELIDEIVGGFENALDAVVRPDAGARATVAGEAEYYVEHDAAQLQDLFANIAASYVQPVKGFILELRDGQAAKEWIEICRPALESINRAAHSMGYADLSDCINRFDRLLISAAEHEGRLISGKNKQEILASYQELEMALPQAFSLGDDIVAEFSTREGIIINSLLRQVKSVGATTIRKLFAAGMTSLENYYAAKKVDLIAVSGIRPWLAERICQRFQEYQREQQRNAGDGARAHREKLSDLIEELKRQQFLFKKATLEEWYSNAESENKKLCRKQRQQTMWLINLALAECGSKESMALLKDMKKQIFERRIEELQNYLDHPG